MTSVRRWEKAENREDGKTKGKRGKRNRENGKAEKRIPHLLLNYGADRITGTESLNLVDNDRFAFGNTG